jgi:type IV pilus assembly protein PilA
MYSRITNNKGFSLTELMVVVAIIGILATMAVPQVQKFMARARQAEAKTQLGSIYTANKGFFAEYNRYATSLPVIGYAPEGRLRYNAGFGEAVEATDYPPELEDKMGDDTLKDAINSEAFCQSTLEGGGACELLPEATIAGDIGDTAAVGADFQTFTAEARSSLTRSDTKVDSWSINESKFISQLTDGVN